MSLHEDMPIKVNKVFTSQPLDSGRGSLDPLGPPRPPWYFKLLMVNLGKPPLLPNIPYYQPFNYLECVKDFDPDVHVKVFKTTIKINSETSDAKIVNLFSFTLKDIVSN